MRCLPGSRSCQHSPCRAPAPRPGKNSMGFLSACSGITGSLQGAQAALPLGWQGLPALLSPGVNFFKAKMIKMKDKVGFPKGPGRCWGLHKVPPTSSASPFHQVWKNLVWASFGDMHWVGGTPGWVTGDRPAVTPPSRQVWGQSGSGGCFSRLPWVIRGLNAEGKP